MAQEKNTTKIEKNIKQANQNKPVYRFKPTEDVTSIKNKTLLKRAVAEKPTNSKVKRSRRAHKKPKSMIVVLKIPKLVPFVKPSPKSLKFSVNRNDKTSTPIKTHSIDKVAAPLSPLWSPIQSPLHDITDIVDVTGCNSECNKTWYPDNDETKEYVGLGESILREIEANIVKDSQQSPLSFSVHFPRNDDNFYDNSYDRSKNMPEPTFPTVYQRAEQEQPLKLDSSVINASNSDLWNTFAPCYADNLPTTYDVNPRLLSVSNDIKSDVPSTIGLFTHKKDCYNEKLSRGKPKVTTKFAPTNSEVVDADIENIGYFTSDNKFRNITVPVLRNAAAIPPQPVSMDNIVLYSSKPTCSPIKGYEEFRNITSKKRPIR